MRRRSLLLAMLAGVTAAAVAIPVFALGGRSGSHVGLAGVSANNVGMLDAGGRITAESALRGAPSGVAAGFGAIWVTTDDGTLSRIDSSNPRIEPKTIPVGSDPSEVVAYHGFVWVVNSADGTVTKVDPQTNRTVGSPIVVGNGPRGIAAGGGSIWVADAVDGTVARLDPGRGRVSRWYPTGRYASGVVYGAGTLWVSDESSDTVRQIDPKTGHALATVQLRSGSGPRELAYGGGALWVADSLDTTVARIDPGKNSPTAVIQVGEGPRGIAVDGQGVWVSVEHGDKLVRIDPGTNSVSKQIPIGSRPEGIAVAGGDVFVAARGSASSHRGGTLTVLNQDYGSLSNSLVSFRRANGAESSQVVPDLAKSLPAPTDGGLTYTFQLRRGIHYSNGELVRPEDVRHSIERDFKLNAGYAYFGPIVGTAACAASWRTCDLSRGIVADDSKYTVTFHLTAPDPYFLYESREPLVPAKTPDREVNPKALPVTGPYMAQSSTPRETILVRNPHFHVWSEAAQPDGYADRIVEKFNISPRRALHMVERGQAELAPVPPGDLSQIRSRYPNRLHVGQTFSTSYLILNTHLPPFNDVRARQAVNFAIDRNKLRDPGDHTACQILPPNFPGYRPYCPYTVERSAGGAWVAPDLARARELVRASHTRGTPVTLVWPNVDARTRAEGRYLASLLRGLGYRTLLRLEPFPEPYFSALADPHTNVGRQTTSPDYPAAAEFINALFTCHSPASLFCDRAVDAQIGRALALDGPDQGAANQLWASIDHMLVDRAPIVPLETLGWAFLLSRRAGNLQVQPAKAGANPLLDQLWVG